MAEIMVQSTYPRHSHSPRELSRHWSPDGGSCHNPKHCLFYCLASLSRPLLSTMVPRRLAHTHEDFPSAPPAPARRSSAKNMMFLPATPSWMRGIYPVISEFGCQRPVCACDPSSVPRPASLQHPSLRARDPFSGFLHLSCHQISRMP